MLAYLMFCFAGGRNQGTGVRFWTDNDSGLR